MEVEVKDTLELLHQEKLLAEQVDLVVVQEIVVQVQALQVILVMVAGNTPTDPNHPQVQGYKGGDSNGYVEPYNGGGGELVVKDTRYSR